METVEVSETSESSERAKKNKPVRVVHADRLLSGEYLGTMGHHTRFVERRLSVEEEDVAVPEMAVDLLRKRGRLGRELAVRVARERTLVRDHELSRDRRALVLAELFLRRRRGEDG